ncbi:Bug family tripartite tricarboxylate transporter substrate binding protein [Roseomonas sp. BN140053]|uniref:Bug family tripartite tricarboxylate transporter substrate binding protein n=1 Tax=Roseomonas sp. BN140053 TaxID=3391898 RepID=UPI0039ED3AC1
MLHHPSSRRALLAASLFTPFLARGARAAFPDHPVKWIVPYAPGGGADVTARLVGAGLSAQLGQPVVIDNRPGAGTNIGAEATARSPADGYTVMTADNGTLVFNPVLYRRLPYDADRDLRPVGLIARFPLMLAVAPASGITSAREFLDRARATPGGLDYGSPGVGSPHHLTMERFARESGVSLTHVPYRGAAPALNDLIAGAVPAMVLDLVAGAEALRAGQARPLAACSAARLPAFPDVPTMQEIGLANFESYAWQGLVLPRATPDPLVAQLSAGLQAALRDERIAARMRELSVEPLPGGEAEFTALLGRERAVWTPLIRTLGITLDS